MQAFTDWCVLMTGCLRPTLSAAWHNSLDCFTRKPPGTEPRHLQDGIYKPRGGTFVRICHKVKHQLGTTDSSCRVKTSCRSPRFLSGSRRLRPSSFNNLLFFLLPSSVVSRTRWRHTAPPKCSRIWRHSESKTNGLLPYLAFIRSAVICSQQPERMCVHLQHLPSLERSVYCFL